MPDKAQLQIQHAEACRLAEEALREIELGHTSFEAELERLKSAAKACKPGRDDKDLRHYTLAKRMLAKKAKDAADARQPSMDEVAAD